jgi:hypothetical protein
MPPKTPADNNVLSVRQAGSRPRLPGTGGSLEKGVKENPVEFSETFLLSAIVPIYLSNHHRHPHNANRVFEGKVMLSSVSGELDFIEELRLRRWAREHYVPAEDRESSWHPVIHDEMNKKDLEAEELVPTYA